MDFARSTVGPSDLNLLNVLDRGGTADWQALYSRAKTDIALRYRIRCALKMVDQDLGATAALWEVLLRALDTRYPAALESSDTDGARSF